MLTEDPESHLKNLQTAPTIEATVDRCIQCGFCEPVCPSRNLTTTPRQRIALRREMARQAEGSRVCEQILADYDYDAIQTCAGDGSCGIACPVDINTGALMKHFRHLEHGPRAEHVAATLARQFGTVERVARIAVGAANATAERARPRHGRSRDQYGPRGRQQGSDARLVAEHAACREGEAAHNAARRRCWRLLHRMRQPHLRPDAWAASANCRCRRR